MPEIDLRLYNKTATYDSKFPDSEVMGYAVLSQAPAQALEVLGNKVVKFLKTTYGSDALEPTYGSRAFSTPQISQAYLPRFRLEIEKDIARCATYIKNSEVVSTSKYKLSQIVLRDIKYDPLNSPTRIDIFIEILTVERERALVALTHII